MAAVEEATRQQAFSLCGDFLGGMWKSISYEEFNIEPIRGGLSNLLFLCSLPENVTTEEDEPNKVVLRKYGPIIQENPETVITYSVIFSILAEKQMGPRLYGVFTGGRVEEYIKSRHLYTEELHRPDISVACARVMARFHQLKIPLVKEPRWLFDVMTRYLDEALNNLSSDNPDARHEKIMSYRLESEFTCLRKLLGQVNSPVVFCHNDLQEGDWPLNDCFLIKLGQHGQHQRQNWYFIVSFKSQSEAVRTEVHAPILVQFLIFAHKSLNSTGLLICLLKPTTLENIVFLFI